MTDVKISTVTFNDGSKGIVAGDKEIKIYNRLVEISNLKSEIEKEYKALHKELESLIGENEALVRPETYEKMAWFTEVVSNRFDTTKFKKENEELYKKYLKESKSRRLNFGTLSV